MLRISLVAAVVFFLLPAASITAQPIIRLQGAAAVPAGDLEKYTDVGYGGSLSLSIPLLFNGFEVTASGGYYHCGYKEDLPDYDFTYTTIPLTAGFRINLSDIGFIPYIGVESGVYFAEYFLEIDYGAIGKHTAKTKDTNWGIAPEIGFRMNLTPYLDIDASAKYNHIKSKYVGRSFLIIQSGFSVRL